MKIIQLHVIFTAKVSDETLTENISLELPLANVIAMSGEEEIPAKFTEFEVVKAEEI
jgi:hypothetical protein